MKIWSGSFQATHFCHLRFNVFSSIFIFGRFDGVNIACTEPVIWHGIVNLKINTTYNSWKQIQTVAFCKFFE